MAKKERTRGQNFGGGGSGASRAYATSRMRDPGTMAATRARDRYDEELLRSVRLPAGAGIVGMDPSVSPRPEANPRRPAVTERGSRHDEGTTVAEEVPGSQAPGVSMRPVQRPAKKFADGGMVRGCKPGQMSGKGFRGTY